MDKLIIGAGLYGLYAALYCARRGQQVEVLEIEQAPFTRATYINQARVHMGYHYPRSLSTAMKSAGYFKRFVEDYSFCIHTKFEQIYATSAHFSWTDAAEFRKFCKDAGIPCKSLPVEEYFQPGLCDGAFLTEEYTYDAHILRDYLLGEIAKYPGVKLHFGREITEITKQTGCYEVTALYEGKTENYRAPFILNATYASVNQVLRKVKGVPTEDFGLKYELCEIILCKASDKIRNIGFTVMDGPFFSIMPFGKTGYHSLTSVTFTPHKTSYDATPQFPCMGVNGSNAGCDSVDRGSISRGSLCRGGFLGNCNDCPEKPESAWEYMSTLARKYLREEYEFSYEKSLFSMKPILKASEIDDSRPTVIRTLSEAPVFISVLSGKINTVYDLDPYLD